MFDSAKKKAFKQKETKRDGVGDSNFKPKTFYTGYGYVLKQRGVIFQFLESMQLKYHEEAASKGIHIVGTCGFDSIPADMGVTFTQENFPGYLQVYCM